MANKKTEELKGVFSISLDKGLVKDAIEIQKQHGGKLSPVINQLLSDWVRINKQLLKEMNKAKELMARSEKVNDVRSKKD